MKYIILLFLIIVSIKPISYAKRCWDKKNKTGAIGALFIAVLAVAIPSVMAFTR